MPNILTIEDLSYSIHGHQVLRDFELTIKTGQFYAVAGENGAGKSTLIKLVLDLIRTPAKGRITVNGQNNRLVSVRKFIGYLPEKFSVKKEVAGIDFLQFIYAMNRQKWDQKRVFELCDSFDFDSVWLKRKTSRYSKGMLQKLGLISCLMLDKELLILDEPLSGLDPKARYLFKRLLEVERKSNRTIFYSTHMLADAEEICDRLGILHSGKIVFDGTPQECKQQFDASTLEQAYMRCISADEAHGSNAQASSG